MRLFGRDRDAIDAAAALASIAGLVLGLVTGIFPAQATAASTAMLWVMAVLLLGILVYKLTRTMYVIYGADECIRELARLVSEARLAVWTARAHTGDADIEQPYFESVLVRALSKERPLQDVRRLLRLNTSDSTLRHLYWLIDHFADNPAVKVRYYVGPGPALDFMVRDNSASALGLPMAGGDGFAGTLFFTRKDVVSGLRDTFDQLWNTATPLFSGVLHSTEEHRAELKRRVDRAIATLSANSLLNSDARQEAPRAG